MVARSRGEKLHGVGGNKTEHEVNSQPKQPARLWFHPGVFSERFSYEGTVISSVGLLRLFFLHQSVFVFLVSAESR